MLKCTDFKVTFIVNHYGDEAEFVEVLNLPYRTEEWETENNLFSGHCHIQQAKAILAKMLNLKRHEITIKDIRKVHNYLIVEEYGR